MSLSRRRMLAILGGGTVVAASSFAGYRLSRSPTTAFQPWEMAGSHIEPRRRALSFALLAPNPHNQQPWLVDLSEPETVVIYANPEKLLPETDPLNRQITIGMGAFFELMRMAAAEDGFRIEFDYFPDGASPAGLDHRPIARAVFERDPSLSTDPLFAHALARRSNKEPFDTSLPVAPDDVARLAAAVSPDSRFGATLDPEEIAFYREMTVDALRVELTTPRTHKESVDVFRIGHREVDANPDGIDLAGPMFEGLKLAGLFDREKASDPTSFAFKGGLDAVAAYCTTAMGFVWLVTPENTRRDQLAAGRDWLRVNLAATGLGLGLHPLSQALQEYPEMQDHYETIHRRLAPEGGTVQMFGRIGYGPTVGPSPRWTLEHKVVAS